jgi:hypothetical protein
VALPLVPVPHLDQPNGWILGLLGALEEAALEPPGLIVGMSHDQDFIGGVLPQGLRSGNHGIAIPGLAQGGYPEPAQRFQGGLQPLSRLAPRAFDVAQPSTRIGCEDPALSSRSLAISAI